MLLDLNMPRMNGHQVLEAVKNDEALASVPVIVLTTSSADSDIAGSYQSHANCFITKPVDLKRFGEIVKLIEGFWLDLVRLPNASRQSTG